MSYPFTTCQKSNLDKNVCAAALAAVACKDMTIQQGFGDLYRDTCLEGVAKHIALGPDAEMNCLRFGEQQYAGQDEKMNGFIQGCFQFAQNRRMLEKNDK
jgi:hypothetical protein